MTGPHGVRRRHAWPWAPALALTVLTGCGTSTVASVEQTTAPSTSPATPLASNAPVAAAPSPTPPPVRPTGTVITTASSDFGVMLFDAKGQAIYLFDKERTDKAECYDRCAAAWPPVLTKGAAVAAGATRSDLLGSTTRDDGRQQVTYAGHPLYYYAHEDPHQVLCHNVVEYGGRWLVVTPKGTAAAA